MAKGNHLENRQRNQGQNLQAPQRRKKSLSELVHQRLQVRSSFQIQLKDSQPSSQTPPQAGRGRKRKGKASVYASAISLLLFDVEEVLSTLLREEDSDQSIHIQIAILSLLQAVQALSLLQRELLSSGSRSKKLTFSESNQTQEDLR